MPEQPLINEIISLEDRAQCIRELASRHERDAIELRELSETIETSARGIRELVSTEGQPDHPTEALTQ